MTGPWDRVAGDATLLIAANVLLQVTVLTGVGIIVAGLFRHNATVRHCILLSVLLSMSAIPVLTVVFAAAGFSFVAFPVTWNSTDAVESAARTASVVRDAEPRVEIDESNGSEVDASDESSLLLDKDERGRAQVAGIVRPSHARSIAKAAMLIWLLGTLVTLSGIARSGWRVRRIIRGARPLTRDGQRTIIREVFRTLGVRSLPNVACSSKVAGPCVAGVVRPVLILPTRLCGILDARKLRHVLLHETAHVLRRDQFIVVLQQALGAVFWPHPLVHLVNRQLARAREEVCDNYVLATVAPADYGETLLRLAQLMPRLRLQPASVGILDRRWKLEDRITDLLDSRRNTMIRLRPTLATAIFFAAVICSVGVAGSKIGQAAPRDLEHINASPMEEAGAYHISPVFRKLVKVIVIMREGPRGLDHTRTLEGWNYDKNTGRLTVQEMVDNEKEMVVVYGKRKVPWAWQMRAAISEVKVLIGKEAAVRGKDYLVDEAMGIVQFLKKKHCHKGVRYHISCRYRDEPSRSVSMGNHPDQALVRRFLGLHPIPHTKADVGNTVGTNASRTDDPRVWTMMQSMRSDSIRVGLGRRSVEGKLDWLERGLDFAYDETLAAIALLRDIPLEEDSWMFVSGVPTKRGRFLFHSELTEEKVKVILGDQLLENGVGYEVDYAEGIVTIVDKAIEKKGTKYFILAGGRSMGNHGNMELIHKLLQD